MRIDVHNHLLPDPYVDRLLEWETPVGLREDGDRLYMVHRRSGTASVATGNRIPVNDGFVDIDARVGWMDDHDFERTLVSVSTPNPLDETFTVDQSTRLVRAINDGFFDRHDFDVVLSHMGGVLLQSAGRFERGRSEIDDPTRRPDRPVLDYVRRFYYDCISFHRPALRAAVDTVGVDHLVFGTDFAFDEEDTRTIVSDVQAVVPDGTDRERIMRSTARDLFDL